MQIVIPMSGTGSRFRAAGYTTLKPLIEVEGRPIIEHIVNMYPGESDFLFICSSDALADTPLRQVLQRICPHGRIHAIAPHKLGPVHAVMQAQEWIRTPQRLSLIGLGAHVPVQHGDIPSYSFFSPGPE